MKHGMVIDSDGACPLFTNQLNATENPVQEEEENEPPPVLCLGTILHIHVYPFDLNRKNQI